MLTGYFPLCFNRPFTRLLVANGLTSDINEDEFISSFMKFVDSFEAEAIQQGQESTASRIESDIILKMLARFNYHAVPTKKKFKSAPFIVGCFVLVSH